MYASLRILAAATLIALMLSFETGDFKSIAWSIALAHYVVALPYSWAKISALSRDPSRWPWLLLLLGAFFVLWETQFSMILYFGVHHVLNEVYMMDRVTRAKGDARVRRLRHASLLLHGSLYAVLVNQSPPFDAIATDVLLGGVALGYLAFFASLFGARAALSPGERFDHVALELAALPIIALALDHPVSVLEMSAYHVLFWMFYPAFAIHRGGRPGMGRYLVTMAVVTAAFLLASPSSPLEAHFSASEFKRLFFLGAYFHITITFALSDANPALVKEAFRPRPRVASPA